MMCKWSSARQPSCTLYVGFGRLFRCFEPPTRQTLHHLPFYLTYMSLILTGILTAVYYRPASHSTMFAVNVHRPPGCPLNVHTVRQAPARRHAPTWPAAKRSSEIDKPPVVLPGDAVVLYTVAAQRCRRYQARRRVTNMSQLHFIHL